MTQSPPAQQSIPTSAPPLTPKFRLTTAKRQVLEHLAEYFCLRPKDLAFLIRKREPTESDVRSVRFTLSRLHAAGLVQREPYFELDRDTGGPTYVFGLSDKGITYSAAYGLSPMKSFDEHSARTLDHELEISQFHIALKHYCEQNGRRLFWQQANLKTATIHPDAMFAIADPLRLPGGNPSFFFLEIERSKLGSYKDGQPSIMRKLGAYYSYYNSHQCEKDWKFRRFRTIVVQRNPKRTQNLLAALTVQFNHRMFWLTCEPNYRNGAVSLVFRTPKDHQQRTYSFLDI